MSRLPPLADRPRCCCLSLKRLKPQAPRRASKWTVTALCDGLVKPIYLFALRLFESQAVAIDLSEGEA